MRASVCLAGCLSVIISKVDKSALQWDLSLKHVSHAREDTFRTLMLLNITRSPRKIKGSVGTDRLGDL